LHLLNAGSNDVLLSNGNAPLHFFLMRFDCAVTPLMSANGLSAQNIPLDAATVDFILL
jgi:hypothetical protein